MKHLISFCASEIETCENGLKPFFEKYGIDTSFKLLHLSSVEDKDRAEINTLIQRKDSYVQVVNKALEKYQAGMLPGDSDLDRKRRGLFSVADTVLEKISKDNVVKWDTMDSIPMEVHMEQVSQCIMANELEYASFGIAYLLYQKRHEKTNLADKRLKHIFSEPTNQPDPVQNDGIDPPNQA